MRVQHLKARMSLLLFGNKADTLEQELVVLLLPCVAISAYTVGLSMSGGVVGLS